ncbi:MAG: PrpF domain-containing protein [Enterobacterales bacterium]|nr:PrpF domain-containing protein [Enterobacterales bacterium]
MPTGNLVDTLQLSSNERLKATLINAGIPTIFINASDIGFSGKELQRDINGNADALDLFEKIRAIGALKMGLIDRVEDSIQRQHTPKIAMVATAQSYTSSSGKMIQDTDIDLNVRALSMGLLHHAMMGTAAVAIATAAAIPGTLVNTAAGGGQPAEITFGHPSGSLKVGAKVEQSGKAWRVEQVIMSRSARRLMEGFIRVPAP